MQRWVLVPGDPSYPEVQQNRFARVGGEIEKLRIGVVNKDGEQLTWLPVECPEEGMYLGQVEWAGNSQEVLVERFSRFRDKRDFLWISVGGEVVQIIEGLVDRLIALGKPFDYMVYPNRDHGLREGGGTVVHVRMHILRYLINNLQSGPRPDNPN